MDYYNQYKEKKRGGGGGEKKGGGLWFRYGGLEFLKGERKGEGGAIITHF